MPNPVARGAAALVVELPVAVAELRAEDALEPTEAAVLWAALRAEAASLVMLPKILLELEVKEARLEAAPVLPVAASELRLERVAEKADTAELKLCAMDPAASLASADAEAADSESSDETEDTELELDAGGSTDEVPVIVDVAPLP
jgi:hypothetical protein